MTGFETRLLKAYHVLNPCKVDRGLQAWFHPMTVVSVSTVRRWIKGTPSSYAWATLERVEARARKHLDTLKEGIGT